MQVASAETNVFGGADADDDFGVRRNVTVFGCEAGEEFGDDAFGNEYFVLGKSDFWRIRGVERVLQDDTLIGDGGGVAHGNHGLEKVFGGATGDDGGAFAEVTGETDGVEITEDAVLAVEILVEVVNFCVGKVEIKVAVGVAVTVIAVVGKREGVSGSDAVGISVDGAGFWRYVLEDWPAGKVVDCEDYDFTDEVSDNHKAASAEGANYEAELDEVRFRAEKVLPEKEDDIEDGDGEGDGCDKNKCIVESGEASGFADRNHEVSSFCGLDFSDSLGFDRGLRNGGITGVNGF